jgi:hypothetical protein
LTPCHFLAHACHGLDVIQFPHRSHLSSWPKLTTFKLFPRTHLAFFPIFPGVNSLKSLQHHAWDTFRKEGGLVKAPGTLHSD